jgi:hypothetical protein
VPLAAPCGRASNNATSASACEPFVAEQPPLAAFEAGRGFDRADVGAASPFGHELRALPHRRDIAGQHPGQQIILQLGTCEFPDQMDRGVGHADRAHQPEFGLHEQILQRVFGDRGQWAVHAEHAGAMAHGMKLEIAECDVLHLTIGRMVFDPVLVAAKTVARMEHRRMLVGDPREFVEPAARKPAEPIDMRLQPPKIVRLQIKRQQVAQAPIDGVEIPARAIRRDVISAAFALRVGSPER